MPPGRTTAAYNPADYDQYGNYIGGAPPPPPPDPTGGVMTPTPLEKGSVPTNEGIRKQVGKQLSGKKKMD
jgi:hypothetical protein